LPLIVGDADAGDKRIEEDAQARLSIREFRFYLTVVPASTSRVDHFDMLIN
jgi:hypothetical protein